MTKAILIALAVVLMAGYAYWSHGEIERLRASEALSRQNLSALSDTLRTVKNEKGHLEHSRLILVQERDELERTNAGLARRINRLSGELEVAIATLAEAETVDTVKTVIEVVGADSSGVHKIRFTYDPEMPDGNRLLVEGFTSFRLQQNERGGIEVYDAETAVTRTLVSLRAIVAIRERDDGLREAVATSSWPGLRLDVQGAILEPKLVMPPRKRSWTLPFGIGFGIGVILWELVR